LASTNLPPMKSLFCIALMKDLFSAFRVSRSRAGAEAPALKLKNH